MSWLADIMSGRVGLTGTGKNSVFSFFGSPLIPRNFGNNSIKQIQEGYENNVDVYAVIKKIADTSKAVPWIVEQRQSDGTWEEITDTTIHELMANPNQEKGLTWDDIEEQMLIYLLSTGNNYMVGEQGIGRGRIEEVDILPPFAVTVNVSENFFMPNISYSFSLDTTARKFEKEQIEHVRFFNPAYSTLQESFDGLSLIRVAAMVVQSGNKRWHASASIFDNRGMSGFVSGTGDGRPLTKEEGQEIQAAFEAKSAGPHNYGKTIVTPANVRYTQIGMSPQDLQLIEQGVVTIRTICNVFGLDSSLFNDPANKTFNNRKEAEKALYTNAIMPLSTKIAEAHTKFIAQNHFPEGNVRMRQDFSGIEVLQEDLNEKSKTLTMLREIGAISANEVREAINHEPSTEENADKLIVVRNNIPLEDIGNVQNQ